MESSHRKTQSSYMAVRAPKGAHMVDPMKKVMTVAGGGKREWRT